MTIWSFKLERPATSESDFLSYRTRKNNSVWDLLLDCLHFPIFPYDGRDRALTGSAILVPNVSIPAGDEYQLNPLLGWGEVCAYLPQHFYFRRPPPRYLWAKMATWNSGWSHGRIGGRSGQLGHNFQMLIRFHRLCNLGKGDFKQFFCAFFFRRMIKQT